MFPGTATAVNSLKFVSHLVVGLTIAVRLNLRCSRYTSAAVDSVQHSKSLHTKDPPSSSRNSAAKACRQKSRETYLKTTVGSDLYHTTFSCGRILTS